MSCPVDGAVCATYSLWITSLYSRQSSSPESPPPPTTHTTCRWRISRALAEDPRHFIWAGRVEPGGCHHANTCHMAGDNRSLSPLLDIHGALWAAKEPW